MVKKKRLKRAQRRLLTTCKRSELIKYLQNEIQSSSIHGLPYIVDHKINWIERIFWIVSFVCSLIIIYTLISSQFARFINSPTVMSVEMDYLEWNISYPALTLCPLIKANFTSFNKLVDNLYNETGMYLEKYVWAVSIAAEYNLDALALTDPNNTNPINPADYAKTAAQLFKQFDKQALTSNFNYSISIQSAMTEMGMCHVINSNVAVFDDPKKWNNEIVTYIKKNVELSVFDADFYTEIINDDALSYVFIHSPDETILSTSPSYTVDKDGFITYGFQIWSTKVSKELRATSIHVRKCRFLDEPISTRYPVYSYNNCLLECRIQLILKLCGCVPHFYKRTGHERTCKISELKCFLQYRREIMGLSVSNDTQNKFTTKGKLPKSSKDCKCLSNCETDIYRKDSEDLMPDSSANRLRIIISFPKIRIVRDIIFSFSDIFLRCGGVINTCIGSSVISLMELIMVFIRIPIFFFTKIFFDLINEIRFN
ncbi:unnamed protein product [Parnassius mnemosyne]|uniref:Uncharacterized protein n=1 Tax=Parnassius mnemosyne TaxID=213953 RepID=A0AAV1KDB8_9NEOP